MGQNEFLNKFEMRFLKILRERKLTKYLLAVSGGLDSMVLWKLFERVKARGENIHLRICHIHHGLGADPEQNAYRDHALEFVKHSHTHFFSKETLFISNEREASVSHLSSEDDFRQYRYERLYSYREEDEILVTAHHKDDLLETRLIRLIRGTGPEGLKAMQVNQGILFRPLLRFSRNELLEYAKSQQIEFLEDPSNQNTNYMRNWIRNTWLPELEAFRPGAIESLTRSLENLTQVIEPSSWIQDYFTENGIDKSKLCLLTKEQTRQVFASYLYSKGVRDFKNSQLNEILKRLDTDQNSLTFRVMGLDWVVEPNKIYVS